MPELSAEVRSYLADSYPHNHGYRVVRGRMRPNAQLRRRWKKLRRLWPDPMESFLDLGCSKGFFVLASAAQHACKNALGIDVSEEPIRACREVQRSLGLTNVRFELARLDQVAGDPEAFGAPFETVQLVNTYQYLFFGSRISSQCYENHAEIFAQLDAITSKQILFSNRLELQDLPTNVQERAAESGRADLYSTDAVLAAASEHFRISRHGKLGRIPLWQLHKA
ncbi:MAG: methyltransferase domain-containing protein [Planctomycetota bacterium]|jgi:SAM-dependent methyltransferase